MTEKFTEAEKAAAEDYSKNYPWSMYGFTIAKYGFLAGIAYLKPQLEAERKRAGKFKAVLETISAPQYGLDLNDSEYEQEDYWASVALRYRKLAREALTEEK
jgi:hypothetical protein